MPTHLGGQAQEFLEKASFKNSLHLQDLAQSFSCTQISFPVMFFFFFFNFDLGAKQHRFRESLYACSQPQ